MASRLPYIRPYGLFKLSFIRSYTKFSFIPNPQMAPHETEILDSKVPDMPDVSKGPRLYTDMIRPDDVCDLVLRPNFNDIIITALADGAPFTGDPKYKLTSKSTVSGSKFLFANITARWIDDFNELLPNLQPIPEQKMLASFMTETKRLVLDKKFTPEVISSSGDLQIFIEAVKLDVGLESTVEYLLSQPLVISNISKYALIMDYLTHNVGSLSRQNLPDFVDYLIRDAESCATSEKASIIDLFVTDSVLTLFPDVIKELSPSAVNSLAGFALHDHNTEAAKLFFKSLIDTHKMAPLKETFKHFISIYSSIARQKEKNKERILKDLTCLKPIMFHYGLDANSFELLLSRVIDNSYDLAQFVRLALLSPELLGDYAEHILLRLHHIHKQSGQSQIAKAVETTQFVRLLLHDYGVKLDSRLRSVLQMICDEQKISIDDMKLTKAST